jgi:hypothetical protein
MKQIGVTRFTDITYSENKEWKHRKKYNGCVYGFDREISMTDFNYLNDIYTIDIRCSPNTKKSPPHIYGIGKIKCISKYEWRSRIYTNEAFNRFIYKGNKYINRNDLIANEENKKTIENLEKLLCTGARHFKRGDGLSKLSYERIMTFDPNSKPIPQRCLKCGLLKRGHICKKKDSKIKISFPKRCKICQDPLKQNGGRAHICLGRKQNREFLICVLRLLDNFNKTKISKNNKKV